MSKDNQSPLVKKQSRFVMNTWYVAAWADELAAGAVLRRIICDEPMVLFRGDSGVLGALGDQCPHRFAPLGFGDVKGSNLQCRYHGLQFNPEGRCAANPHGPITDQIRARAFPIVERHKALWVWMGEWDLARPELIPDFDFLNQVPSTAFNKGYLHTRANYILLMENILDLSHVDYLHPDTLGAKVSNGTGAVTGVKPRVEATDDRLEVVWDNPYATASGMLVSVMGFAADAPVQLLTKATWFPVGAIRLTAAFSDQSCKDRPFVIDNCHILTPETNTTSHYFFASTRNFSQHDSNLNDRISAMRKAIFEKEDEWMCHGVQENMGEQSFWDMKPALLSTDVAPVRMRRTLDCLLEES